MNLKESRLTSHRWGPDWVSLEDHLADTEAEAAELCAQVCPEDEHAKAVTTAARWHDWGKSLSRWQEAALKTSAANREKTVSVLSAPEHSQFHECIREWPSRFTAPEKNTAWAKFPDIRTLVAATSLPDAEKRQLKRLVYAPFSPGHRHEAASALAAWDLWRSGDKSLNALTVYLIACHHGKVRTVMRRTKRDAESDVFGLRTADVLQPVSAALDAKQQLNFGCCRFGATGTWDEDATSFHLETPSWLQMVSELVDAESTEPGAIPESEPHALGPLAIAYLEALICVADIRASKQPGKGQTR